MCMHLRRACMHLSPARDAAHLSLHARRQLAPVPVFGLVPGALSRSSARLLAQLLSHSVRDPRTAARLSPPLRNTARRRRLPHGSGLAGVHRQTAGRRGQRLLSVVAVAIVVVVVVVQRRCAERGVALGDACPATAGHAACARAARCRICVLAVSAARFGGPNASLGGSGGPQRRGSSGEWEGRVVVCAPPHAILPARPPLRRRLLALLILLTLDALLVLLALAALLALVLLPCSLAAIRRSHRQLLADGLKLALLRGAPAARRQSNIELMQIGCVHVQLRHLRSLKAEAAAEEGTDALDVAVKVKRGVRVGG
mmetsp:Transcript_7156/g.22907  ORF Transcript_7156/g.22907 Transcript_7156/m.22907 type:complete len:313 (-) Transcript_7156:848-1786(-)